MNHLDLYRQAMLQQASQRLNAFSHFGQLGSPGLGAGRYIPAMPPELSQEQSKNFVKATREAEERLNQLLILEEEGEEQCN